jgi:hypothetical protein
MLMKRLLWLAVFAALATTPCMAPAQSSGPASGVGPHGWDYYIGTWTCTNTLPPSAQSGPATVTVKIAASPNAGTPLFFRATAAGFDESGFVSYSSKTKSWSNPASYADGSYSFESTTQTGKKTTWTGTYYNAASGTATHLRDTYTLNPGSYTDLTQMNTGGGWKTTANSTCTKS